MNIVDTNIEYLTNRLDGATKLMDLVLQEMERESIECEGEGAFAANFFLERMRNVYVDCMIHVFADIEEVKRGLCAEIQSLYAEQSRAAK